MRALIAAALAAATVAAAAAQTTQSPACALLTTEEATGFLGGEPMVSDGGPEMAGSSSCSWLTPATTGMIGVQVMKPEAFGGEPDSYFDLMVSSVTNTGQTAEPLQGIGNKAVLIADPTGVNMVVMAQAGDKLLTVTTMNVTREVMIAAATLLAERL